MSDAQDGAEDPMRTTSRKTRWKGNYVLTQKFGSLVEPYRLKSLTKLPDKQGFCPALSHRSHWSQSSHTDNRQTATAATHITQLTVRHFGPSGSAKRINNTAAMSGWTQVDDEPSASAVENNQTRIGHKGSSQQARRSATASALADISTELSEKPVRVCSDNRAKPDNAFHQAFMQPAWLGSTASALLVAHRARLSVCRVTVKSF